MLDAGIKPDTISSDVHGTIGRFHDEATCGYSMVGTMSKLLLALAMSLKDVIECSTCHPADVLGMTDEIGTQAVGTRADVTILEPRTDDWMFIDPGSNTIRATERLVPNRVVRAGHALIPTRRLLRDVLTSEERGESGQEVAAGGRPI